MAELYDVVFYGADNQADNIDETKEKVARLLKVSGSKLEALFEKKGGTTLRKGVSLKVAKKYQQAIVQAGGRCRFQRANDKPEKLELGVMTSEFVCSDCGYKQVLENNESEPSTCPECSTDELEQENVVQKPKSKHENLTYVVTDNGVAEIDVSLLEKQQQQQKQKKEAAAAVVVKNTSKSSVKSLFFSGVTGIVIGAMGVFAYNHYLASNATDELIAEKNAAKLVLAEQAVERKNARQVLPDLKPSQQALMNINQLSLKIMNGSLDMNAEAVLLPDYFTDISDEIATDMINPEQDLTMISLMQRLIDVGKLSQAYQISHSINHPIWRFNWAGKVASAFAEGGNIDASSMIWTTMRTETNKLSKVHERIDKLSKLALFKADADDLTGAQMLLQNAESLTKNIKTPEIKALSLGYIAAIQSKIGLQITSENNFSLANQALTASTDTDARLFAFIELARAYFDAGEKSTALGILNGVLQASRHITNPIQRNRLLGRVAYGLSVAGDSQAAFDAIGIIEPDYLRDENLYRIIVGQVQAKLLYQALSTVEQFQTVVYQAKAHALLARFFVGTSMEPLVAGRFDLATQVSSYITDVPRQAVVMSEIARYQARTGEAQKASQLFAASFILAQQVSNSYERDNAFEQIARNQAMVAQIALAMQTAQNIVDEGLKKLIMDEIRTMKKTHRILDSFESSMS